MGKYIIRRNIRMQANYTQDIDSLMLKNSQQVIMSYLATKKPQLIHDLSTNSFPVPTMKRSFKKAEQDSLETQSTDGSCQMLDETAEFPTKTTEDVLPQDCLASNMSIESTSQNEEQSPKTNFRPFFEGEEELVRSGHYSGILPVNDKKAKLINQCIATFEKNLFGEKFDAEFDFDLYSQFIKTLKSCLSALGSNWKALTRGQQGEYLAASLLMIICSKLNIKQIAFQKSFEPVENGNWKKVKVSSLRKCKAYLSLENIMKQI